MQKAGSALVLSLTGMISVFNSRQTKVPRYHLLCDLVASLQGLISKTSVENGTFSNGFWSNHLSFAQ